MRCEASPVSERRWKQWPRMENSAMKRSLGLLRREEFPSVSDDATSDILKAWEALQHSESKGSSHLLRPFGCGQVGLHTRREMVDAASALAGSCWARRFFSLHLGLESIIFIFNYIYISYHQYDRYDLDVYSVSYEIYQVSWPLNRWLRLWHSSERFVEPSWKAHHRPSEQVMILLPQ